MKEKNKCKLNGNMSLYKELRNKVTNMIKTAKTKTYQPTNEEGKSDARTIWKLFKEFRMKGKGNSGENNLEIKCENELITKESDLADILIITL